MGGFSSTAKCPVLEQTGRLYHLLGLAMRKQISPIVSCEEEPLFFADKDAAALAAFIHQHPKKDDSPLGLRATVADIRAATGLGYARQRKAREYLAGRHWLVETRTLGMVPLVDGYGEGASLESCIHFKLNLEILLTDMAVWKTRSNGKG